MTKSQKIKKVIKDIHAIALEIERSVNLMEVCGTHTQAISRFGIKSLMPENVKLVTGPGCPVCVTAQEDIDLVVNLALQGIPIASYGDMLRVPGYYGSLDDAKSKGADVFTVYSTDDALNLQKQYPNLVFFGIGFETTTPMTSYAIKKGLTVFSSHKLFIPAMEALLKIGELNIDGFICPGHVSTIVGITPFRKLPAAQAITGFEQDDILVGIYMLLKQISEGRKDAENQYLRSVREKGNPKAYKFIFDVFDVMDGNWRGFGKISKSGLEIKEEFSKFNAKVIYKDILSKVDLSVSGWATPCRCGEIIRGLKSPKQCPIFGKLCSPEKPKGPCMVSEEGACNVEYKYGR